jgi:hypothetical protein
MATVEDALDRAVATTFGDALDLALLATSAHLLPIGFLDEHLLARL